MFFVFIFKGEWCLLDHHKYIIWSGGSFYLRVSEAKTKYMKLMVTPESTLSPEALSVIVFHAHSLPAV